MKRQRIGTVEYSGPRGIMVENYINTGQTPTFQGYESERYASVPEHDDLEDHYDKRREPTPEEDLEPFQKPVEPPPTGTRSIGLEVPGHKMRVIGRQVNNQRHFGIM
jgi:hypothetical protein